MANPIFYNLNQAARNFDSDKKPVRRAARNSLVTYFKEAKDFNLDQKIARQYPTFAAIHRQFKELQNLEKTLEYHNISTILSDAKATRIAEKELAQKIFPYAMRGSADVSFKRYTETSNPDPDPCDDSNKDPAYIALMPHLASSKSPDCTTLKEQIDLINREGFVTTEDESRALAAKRLRVVVLVNSCQSLLPTRNKTAKVYAQNCMNEVSSKTVSVILCRWAPAWKPHDNAKAVISNKYVKRLFRLYLDYDKDRALLIFDKIFNLSGKVPYQGIREELKNSQEVISHAICLRHGNKNRKLSLWTCDDDAIRLRAIGDKGLFSHYDDAIRRYPEARIITTGYYMKNSKDPFVEFATRTDLAQRRAIAQSLPSGVYYSEVNLLLPVPASNTSEYIGNKISYYKAGDGGNLESIRLMEHMNLMQINTIGQVVFWLEGEIQTTQPPRAKVKASMQALVEQHG